MSSSIPFRKYFSNIQQVSQAAFSTPYPNLLLFTTNPYFTSNQAFVEVSSGTEYKSKFGSADGVAGLLDFYFGTINEAGLAPKKAVIARQYVEDVSAFVIGAEAPATLAEISAFTTAQTFTLSMGGQDATISVDVSSSATYSDVATVIQTAIRGNSAGGESFTNATFVYDTDIKRFVLKSGTTGLESTIDAIGTSSLLDALGGFKAENISNGVGQETMLDAFKRVYAGNPEAFLYYSIVNPSENDIVDIVSWSQGVENQQSIALDVMPMFRFDTKAQATSVGNTIKGLGMSGYVLLFDVETDKKFVFKSAGLFASFDIDVRNSRMGGNFHQISGVKAINNYDSPIDYQNGITNELYVKDLDDAFVSYPYTLGVGTQATLLFGQGATGVDGGTVGSAVAFSILDKEIKKNLANLNISIANFPLRGASSNALVSSALTPAYIKGNDCGLLAQGATLNDSTKAVVINAFGQDAVVALEKQGWYFRVEDRTEEDIRNKQIRVSDALLDAGSADGGVRIRTVVYR